MASRSARFVSHLSRDTLALILAGGRGTRLHELTRWRAKPALFFGGKFRIIDFPLSNCVNSNIRRVGVLTQYRAHSLIRHLVDGWTILNPNLGEFVEVLPASQQMSSSDWYLGTADAVYQNQDIIESHSPQYVLVLAGDHVYKMDYGLMLADHVRSGAVMTVGCIEVPLDEARAFGVMAVDADWRVHQFREKPDDPQPLPGEPDKALASMGIYVFDAQFLLHEVRRDALDPDSTHDFGRDIIPRLIESEHVQAYPFRDPDTGEQGYWRDVGTLDSFWAANLELLEAEPELDLYDQIWPILTHQLQLPPARFLTPREGAAVTVTESMVSGACVIERAKLERALLFSNVQVRAGALVRSSVVLPDAIIGEGAEVQNAIIDRNCLIPPGTSIGFDQDEDRRRFRVSDSGVVLVTPQMLDQL
ncbi:MAG: glucose-1-phosphate adenylyltransferase [Pseudomonadota bacterium]